MHDSSRDSTNTDTFGLLFPNLSNDENRNNPRLDFLSNGFKLRESGNTNIAGGDVFFMAWAESPFQTANAK